jgi:hypothetical protein
MVEHAISHVPVLQWALSLPFPLRVLLTVQPKLEIFMLRLVHRLITRLLLNQAGAQADGGAVTLIQRLGSAANLNIQLHCLVLGCV